MLEKNLQNCRVGYAGVNTYCQAHGALLDQLHAAGCTQIYREKVTGARADLRELLKLLNATGRGDVVTVTRIDRLTRSTVDLFALVKQIVEEVAIPLTGGAVGRHSHQPRAADDCRPGRAGGRRAGSDPAPHSGRPQARESARSARGSTADTHAAKEALRRAEGARSRNRRRPTTSAGRRFRDWRYDQ